MDLFDIIGKIESSLIIRSVGVYLVEIAGENKKCRKATQLSYVRCGGLYCAVLKASALLLSAAAKIMVAQILIYVANVI